MVIDERRAPDDAPGISPPDAPLDALPSPGHPRARIDPTRPAFLLGIAVVVWCVVQFVHVWQRHDRFGTFDNDLGFHTQYVWQLARGRDFSTILGLPAFGHNATIGYLLLLPVSWLGFGPHGLNLVQTVVVGLGAVPVFLLARDRLRDEWLALVLGGLWLLHPVTQGNVWETFHPEAMAMPALLAAYLCATRRSWRWFALWVLLAIVWKADVALFVMVLGLLVAKRGDRWVGLTTAAGALTWFAVVTMLVIPHQAGGGGTVFGPLYSELGDTPTAVARTAVTDPSAVVGRIAGNEPIGYARDLLAPYAFIPLLSPSSLLLAAPQALVNLLPDPAIRFTHDPFDNPHYQALPNVALAIGLVEGVARLRRGALGRARAAIGFAAAFALAATAAWGTLPFSVRAERYWPAAGDPTKADRQAAIDLPPDDATVTAQYLLVPHLAEREGIYSFPNPWRRVFYGVEGTPLPDPGVVEYVVMDTTYLGAADLEVWECVRSSGAFRSVLERGPVVVLERIPGATTDLACQE
jgi:hypothetical protein